ncbi:methyltransferase domain-containing protein [Streptomyces parvulus]|uniref:methyltransferase domain-containing protein n=1 Tax=Streptomyces parvulus TaxID=146923 RepID=UPI001E37C1AF|nr:methyltransferase domain-containing protein [Streptomyces parvulus]MCC9155134.1 methyltransferase domain-containing protein [Streptomyces parvulus]MCE7685297.1 methyltransferase domain-containing protein [Streptomyces parvulus]
MTLPADPDQDAVALRSAMVKGLAEAECCADPAWLTAAGVVPRHAFVPGFYLPTVVPEAQDVTVWQPVTPGLDYGRWLASTYSDATLITQLCGEETDWTSPKARRGGVPTSRFTLPSLIMRTWSDAEIHEGHTVLEIGTGTGYSTALACELLGSSHVTTIEIDSARLERAARALRACGYAPTIAQADGLYGYWPEAWFDRVVAACSFRVVPHVLIRQVRPAGKLLVPLSGWLHGGARVLLTVAEDGTAEGPLLPRGISCMPSRTESAPALGNLADWTAGLADASRPARHTHHRLTDPTDEASHLRFLAQCVVPEAQTAFIDGFPHLVDVVSGSVASLTPEGDSWKVREGGPLALWTRIEQLIESFDAAGRPGPETFTLRVEGTAQSLLHPQMPELRLPVPY